MKEGVDKPKHHVQTLSKAEQKRHNVHLTRLKAIQKRKKGSGTLDNNPPKCMSSLKVISSNPRKKKMRQEEMLRIARSNKVMLQRITKIMTAPSSLSSDDHYTNRITTTLKTPAHREEEERIQRHNDHLHHLLTHSQPYYNTKAWEEDYKRMKKWHRFMRKITYTSPQEEKEKDKEHAMNKKRQGRKYMNEEEEEEEEGGEEGEEGGKKKKEEDINLFLTHITEDLANPSSHSRSDKRSNNKTPSTNHRRSLPPLSSSSSKRRLRKARPQSSLLPLSSSSSPSSSSFFQPPSTQPFPKPNTSQDASSLRRASSLYLQEAGLHPTSSPLVPAASTQPTDPFDPLNPDQLCKSTKMVKVTFYHPIERKEEHSSSSSFENHAMSYEPSLKTTLLTEMVAVTSNQQNKTKHHQQQANSIDRTTSDWFDESEPIQEEQASSSSSSSKNTSIPYQHEVPDKIGPFSIFCRLTVPEAYSKKENEEEEKEEELKEEEETRQKENIIEGTMKDKKYQKETESIKTKPKPKPKQKRTKGL